MHWSETYLHHKAYAIHIILSTQKILTWQPQSLALLYTNEYKIFDKQEQKSNGKFQKYITVLWCNPLHSCNILESVNRILLLQAILTTKFLYFSHFSMIFVLYLRNEKPTKKYYRNAIKEINFDTVRHNKDCGRRDKY